MSNKNEKIQLFLEALDYYNSPGLIWAGAKDDVTHKGFVFNLARKQLGIDGIYFVKDTPIAYFKHFCEFSEQQITDFYLKVWNQGIAPLVFVFLPEEIRVYSAYKSPACNKNEISAGDALLASLKDFNNKDAIETKFSDFSRIEVDTGHFWRVYTSEFSNDNRINQILLHNLKELRKELNAAGLKFEYIHSLIGRTIIILNLEARGLINSEFYHKYGREINSFNDLLSSKVKIYKFFTDLMDFFGKDIFPVSAEEKKAVTLKHLNVLNSILGSKESPWFFWAFKFNIIPVDLICSIYEEFLYAEEKGKDMASYTPPALAQVMLDQVLPYDNKKLDIKILDPACGSSIFLLEAYKRLIEFWIRNNKDSKPTFETLQGIIKTSIYGFDFQIEALRFTIFCLYMIMFDYIDEIDLEKPPKLPPLVGSNLVESDFFNIKSPLNKNKYDIIVGNPPWQSSYGDKAREYLKNTNYPVGDKQISQLFLWHAGDLVTENGSICMLMPSKGLLYNFNPKNIEFREKFFRTFNVKKITNLSLFSNLLFENSKFPASIILYALEKEGKQSKSTLYYTPRPSNKSWEFSTLVVDPSDVKTVPKQQILSNQTIWKIAFVGSARDFALINHLDRTFPKIDYFCEDMEWKYGEGFQLGGGDKNVNNDMAEMLYIPAKSIYPFYLDKKELKKLGNNTFHRPRDFALYKAPHTLVRGGQIYAAYIDYDAVFTHAVMSFSSANKDDAKLLKLLAAYLNSSLVLYYLFLTSSTWCIERTDIHLAEYRTLPFTVPSDDKLLDNILLAYDDLSDFVSENISDFLKSDKYYELKAVLDNFIFDLFKLDNNQRQLIVDANSFSINYFQDYSKSSRSKNILDSINKPDVGNLNDFVERFVALVNSEIIKHNHKLVSSVYVGKQPLDVISFKVVHQSQKEKPINIIESDSEQKLLLKKLDNIVLKQMGESLYAMKNLRVYEGSKFYLVKPSEKRFWTKTMALNDADKMLKELLRGFGNK